MKGTRRQAKRIPATVIKKKYISSPLFIRTNTTNFFATDVYSVQCVRNRLMKIQADTVV